MKEIKEFVRREVIRTKHSLSYGFARWKELTSGCIIENEDGCFELGDKYKIKKIRAENGEEYLYLTRSPTHSEAKGYLKLLQSKDIVGHRINFGSIVNALLKNNISLKPCHAHSEDENIFIAVCHRSELELGTFRWDIFSKGKEQHFNHQSKDTQKVISKLLGFN